MSPLEKRLEYYELLMTYDDTSKYINYELPEGFHFEFYKDGDIDNWVDIHISTGEFANYEKSVEYFHQFYDYFIDELNKRCIFIVDNLTNEKVGTATISLLEKDEDGYEAAVDWVAIKKEYQGRGLSKPLISKFIRLANELGHDKLILHTQTHTWLAAKLYLDLGFEPYKIENSLKGWQILKTLTNHQKLKDIESISSEKMYSKEICLIYEKLVSMFGNNFTYSVWNTNGRNDIYVYSSNKFYVYNFTIEDNEVNLVENKIKGL